MHSPNGLSSRSSPSAWTEWCCSAKRISGRPSENSSTITITNGHTEGLGNELIAPETMVIGTCQTECRERLGGLLKFYYRQAA